jgi:hypothetical protein
VKIEDAELASVTTLNNSMALVRKKLGDAESGSPISATFSAAQ